MFDNLLKVPQVRTFLSEYPRANWNMCLELVFLYGLKTIQREYNYKLSLGELMKLSTMKGYLDIEDSLFGNSTLRSLSPTIQNYSKKTQETQTGAFISKKLQISEQDAWLRDNSCQTAADYSLNRNSLGRNSSTGKYTIEKQSDTISEFKFSHDLKEPQTCPITKVNNLLKVDSFDDFKTRLQKKNGRKDWFPVIDFGSPFLNKHMSPDATYVPERKSMYSSR